MKRMLILLFLLVVSLSAMSQSLSSDVMILERHHGGLRYCGMKDNLAQDDLKQLLDEESYAMYENARKHHTASIPLWVVTGVTTTVSTLFLYGGIRGHIYFNNHPEEYDVYDSSTPKTPVFPLFYMSSVIGYGISLMLGIPATVLTISGNKKLDNIAMNYNEQHADIMLNLGLTDNGFGIVLRF